MAWSSRITLAAGLLASASWVQSVAAWAHTSPEEFHESISGEGAVLAAFVAPNEPRSAALEPEWLSAVSSFPFSSLSSSGSNHRLISIDCSSPGLNGDGDKAGACDREGIDALPLILLFNKGDFIAQYKGPHRADALTNFLTRLTRPFPTLNPPANFKTTDETVFIAYLDPSSPTPYSEIFTDAARPYREEFSFAISTDTNTDPGQRNKIICYKPLDSDTVKFALSELTSVSELTSWIAEASRPVISSLSAWNAERLVARGWPIVYVFAETESERQTLRRGLYKFARTYYDSLTSVVADPSEFPALVKRLGLDAGGFPSGAVHQLSKDRVFHYPRGQALTPGAIQQWGLDVYQGRVKPWTPPGVTTTYDDLGLSQQGTAKVSLMSAPGVTIRVAGHDEL